MSEKRDKALDDNQQKEMRRINSQFFDFKEDLKQKTKNVIEEKDDLNLKKEQELEYLKQEEDEIDSRSVLSIADTYFQNEVEKINESYNTEKKGIDEKHKFKRPKLEMDECDKEKMQNHKKQIKKLNKYSNNSNYNKVINNFSLNDYV